MTEFVDFDPTDAMHIADVAAMWNEACGPDLEIGERAVRYNTLPPAGARQAGRWVIDDGDAAGFVLATAFPQGDPAISPPEVGWVDAIAVCPDRQRRGIGSALLAWAEGWLAEQGCTRFRLGGGLRPFAPGLPSSTGAGGFFRARGYTERRAGELVWDVARDLRGYTTPSNVRPGLPVEVRPARPGDEEALLAFLAREFPGRWRFEFMETLAGGGRISDTMILLTEAGVNGFCQLTFEDSMRPLDRCFMHRLPKPWGQLGPIGVSEACRGTGYGAALLDAGLRRLRDAGIAGCVIDWTHLVAFYSKFGFAPYRQYEILIKTTEVNP